MAVRPWWWTGCACRPIRRPAASLHACSMPAAMSSWQQLTADELHPVNTSLGFEVRSGNVAVPDASWSSFVPVSGGTFALSGRYLQYRAALATTANAASPTLRSVTVSYGPPPPNQDPTFDQNLGDQTDAEGDAHQPGCRRHRSRRRHPDLRRQRPAGRAVHQHRHRRDQRHHQPPAPPWQPLRGQRHRAPTASRSTPPTPSAGR